MERVYHLLRDNVKHGPYTIDELIQHKLDKNDLIWVEGKTLAWAYPSEIEELQKMFNPSKPVEKIEVKTITPYAVSKVYAPQVISGGPVVHNSNAENTAPVKKLTPDEEIEARAEEIRRRALFAVQNHYQYQSPVQDAGYKSPLYYQPGEDIEFKVHKKSKYATAPQLVVALMATSLVALGWFGGWTPLNIKKGTIDVVATPFSGSEQSAPEKQVLYSETENAAKDSLSTPIDSSSTTPLATLTRNSITLIETEPQQVVVETTAIDQPEIVPVKEEKQTEEPPAIKSVETKDTKPIIKKEDTSFKEPAAKEPKEEKQSVDENEPEKKKGFLRNLFKKKNKEDKQEENDRSNR